MEEGTVKWGKPHEEEHLAGLPPIELDRPAACGTHRGQASGGEFFYGDTTTEIVKLSLKDVVFTSRGVDRVRVHLERFGDNKGNRGMLARLDKIVDGELEPTGYDVRFYTHELREACRYAARGWSHNQVPTDSDENHRLWETEHTCALEEYGVNPRRFDLYHPSCPPW